MNDFINKFGCPTRINGSTYTFPCPLCRNEGHDNKGDNLKIKIEGDGMLLTCFKSAEHTKMLRQGVTGIKANYPIIKKKIISDNVEKKHRDYLKWCIDNVKDEYEELIKKNRGLKIQTIRDLHAGIDFEKQAWVLPVFNYPQGNLIGFEYRDIGMLPRKKGGRMWHEVGTFSCLAQVNNKPFREVEGYKLPIDNIMIIEGFIDAYLLYQYIKEMDIVPYHILTPSCGVNTIAKNIKDLQTHTSFTLLLDNDKAGREARKDIIKKSKYGVINYSLPKPYNDFGEYYLDKLMTDKGTGKGIER